METRVTTRNGKLRMSYLNVWEPRATNPGDKPKYSVAILINKDDAENIKLFTDAINSAKELGKTNGKFMGKNPDVVGFTSPLHDGDVDKKGDENYAGKYYINAKNDRPVGIIGADAKAVSVFDKDTVYSGMYGNVSVNFYPYANNGRLGVGCGLNAVQKSMDGIPFSGVPNPEVLFEAFENSLM